VIAGIPLEEILFGLAFGMYWTGVYEHLAWTVTVSRLPKAARTLRRRTMGASDTERKDEKASGSDNGAVVNLLWAF